MLCGNDEMNAAESTCLALHGSLLVNLCLVSLPAFYLGVNLGAWVLPWEARVLFAGDIRCHHVNVFSRGSPPVGRKHALSETIPPRE